MKKCEVKSVNDNRIISMALALLSLKGNDRLLCEKTAALFQLISLINAYQKECPNEKMLQVIFDEKAAFICEATTKADIKEILGPPKIYYDGNKVRPTGRFHIPEEELIIWSLTSLNGPLISHGFERMTEVFAQVFPGIDLTRRFLP